MEERVELQEDDQCPLRKATTIGKHKARIKGIEQEDEGSPQVHA